MKYTCVKCGSEFEARHKTAVCNSCKTATCVICGKEFTLKHPYTQMTCSSKCRGEYRKRVGISKQVAHKSTQTKLMRYGTVSSSKICTNVMTKVCKLCGKTFQTTSTRRIYCEDKHYGPCPVCGKIVEIKDYSIGPQACSKACRVARINKTCLEKYGNKDAVNSDHAKELGKQHSLERYGKEFYSQTDEYKERYKETMNERYGVDYPIQNSQIRLKIEDTNQEKYGFRHPMRNSDVKIHMKATMEERYGGLGLHSPEIKHKATNTLLSNYGVDSPMKSDIIKERSAATCMNRYGVSNYKQSSCSLQQEMSDPEKCRNYICFRDNPISYISTRYNEPPTIGQLCSDLGVTDTPIYDALLLHGASDLICRRYNSSIENEVINYLHSLRVDNIISNNRILIKPYEIDIYLPDYKIGIECDPTVTHNSSFKDPWGGNPKPPSYHKRKNDLADGVGIQLFHIFGYEWTWHKDIIKSMLRSLLHKNERSIYARKCEIKLVDGNDCRWFLNENHRQGNADSSYRYGLYYEGQLVSVMTFSNMRTTIGKKASNNDNTYELVRFCNLRNTNVVGGASKLFKHFLKEVNPSEVVSFSDRAHTTGKLYSILGFEVESYSDSGYVWVNYVNDSYYSRVACQKKNLRKLFNDDSIDIDSMTERQIMEIHGYARVFDSGVIRWRYLNQHIENY